MGEDNKDLFREILHQFITEFRFEVPAVNLPEDPIEN